MKAKPLYYRIAFWSLSLFVVMALLAAAMPKPAQAAMPKAICQKTVTVEAGDNIYRFAKKYGVSVYRIANTNGMKPPYYLTVGQTLCIPEKPKQSSNFTWSAIYSGGQVKVTGDDFKKRHPFHVKVREDDTSAWYKLGKTATDKQGELEDKFELPTKLQKLPALTVCLKDGVTDYLDCKRVFRQ